jgi:ubiquilin
MTDVEASEEIPQITFNVKANDAKYSITIAASATVADLKEKLATSEFADIPADRQRLIYSGRVLKDADSLSSANVKDGHTIHLVRGAASNARQNPVAQPTSSTSSSAPAANIPTNIAAGTGNNPLAHLTGARYAGFHGLPNASTFGADGGVSSPSQTIYSVTDLILIDGSAY